MKYLAIVSILALSSCIITEEECVFENYVYEVSPELESWLPDSLSSIVLYRANNGFEESYALRKPYTRGTWNALPDHCNNRREYIRANLESTITKSEIRLEVQSGPHGDEIIISFNQFYANYNFMTKRTSVQSLTVSNDPWRYIDVQFNFESSDSFLLDNITYNNVLQIKLLPVEEGVLKPHTPQTLYIAKHYGIIAYTQFDGLSWKLIKK